MSFQASNSSKLYTPLQLGCTFIANRIVMAPMARARSDDPSTRVPTDMMVQYYTQRATVGLIITEATLVAPDTSVLYGEPGIYNDNQARGWHKVTNSIHEADGKIFNQLMHTGRTAPASINDGQIPIGPSAVSTTWRYYNRDTGKWEQIEVPRVFSDEEARDVLRMFASGASRAVKIAGFDGVEIHGANGYLINQFLVPQANKRASGYYSGATIKTRARFLLDVVDAVIAEVGADRTGIRISPLVTYNNANYESPIADTAYICQQLNERKIAYVHVERRDIIDATDKRDITSVVKEHFTHGAVISNGGFEQEESEAIVDSGAVDAVAIGVPLLANPDLVRRFREKRPERNAPDKATFYTGGAKGYIDYPYLQ